MFGKFDEGITNETFLVTFEVGQGVSRINLQGFHTSV